MSMGFADLVKIAECDYMACKAMEEHFPDEFAVRTALYHLQQAVEKLLKAVIIYNGEHPAFTHDIGKLADHCKVLGEVFSDNLDDISDSLTLWESKRGYFICCKKFEINFSIFYYIIILQKNYLKYM